MADVVAKQAEVQEIEAERAHLKRLQELSRAPMEAARQACCTAQAMRSTGHHCLHRAR